MKVLHGVLTDEDRAIVFESNKAGRRVCVATLHGCVVRDQRGRTGCEEPMQAVGVVTNWSHDWFEVGGWSFATRIPWASAVKVWWRDEAPPTEEVRARLDELRRPDGEPQETNQARDAFGPDIGGYGGES